jgi:hypothetical protein
MYWYILQFSPGESPQRFPGTGGGPQKEATGGVYVCTDVPLNVSCIVKEKPIDNKHINNYYDLTLFEDDWC